MTGEKEKSETLSVDSFLIEVFKDGGKEYAAIVKENGTDKKFQETFLRGSKTAVTMTYAFAKLMGVPIVAKE